MHRFDEIELVKTAMRNLEKQDITIGFVPTMGSLHAGHLSLVEKLREVGAQHVIASIFVNPTQFNQPSDLETYPSDLKGDLVKLESVGCDSVFFPSADSMYPEGFQTSVQVSKATQGLCGAHRPGHFNGVTTVVNKLLNIVRPSFLVLGEKDFQQLMVVRLMVRDLNMDVHVVGAPLVRDADGLALSSRNVRLSQDQRTQALALHRGLQAAQDAYRQGERSADALVHIAKHILRQSDLEPEYLELRSSETFASLDTADIPCRLLVAAQVGQTRLIDNIVIAS